MKPAHLRVDDVARIGNVTPKSVSNYLEQSRPSGVVSRGPNRGAPRPAGRYVDDPFPAPDHRVGTAPVWRPDQEWDIRQWFGRHPATRPGVGYGGRPRKSAQSRTD